MADIDAAQALIGYHFYDATLLVEALTAAGVVMSSDIRPQSSDVQHGNKRLALLGDTLIRLLAMDDWFPDGASPAEAQKHFNEVGTNKILSLKGSQQGLESMIVNHPSHGDRVPKTMLAPTVEAVVGAV